jgi:hypothetical protein
MPYRVVLEYVVLNENVQSLFKQNIIFEGSRIRGRSIWVENRSVEVRNYEGFIAQIQSRC